MVQHFTLLVVCGFPETRRDLIRMLEKLLEGMPVDIISCSTLDQAREVLHGQTVNLIFCHETLPDGSYRDLLDGGSRHQKTPPVIVTLGVGEWEEYLEALRFGAFDVIRCPTHPTDVELAVIRALRPEQYTNQQAIYPLAG